MVYLSNAFSLSMLKQFPTSLHIKEVGIEEVKELLTSNSFVSAVGHQATADLLTKLLNIQVTFNRIPIQLSPGDILIVFQLSIRLEEGKILSEDELSKLQFKFLLVNF